MRGTRRGLWLAGVPLLLLGAVGLGPAAQAATGSLTYSCTYPKGTVDVTVTFDTALADSGDQAVPIGRPVPADPVVGTLTLPSSAVTPVTDTTGYNIGGRVTFTVADATGAPAGALRGEIIGLATVGPQTTTGPFTLQSSSTERFTPTTTGSYAVLAPSAPSEFWFGLGPVDGAGGYTYTCTLRPESDAVIDRFTAVPALPPTTAPTPSSPASSVPTPTPTTPGRPTVVQTDFADADGSGGWPAAYIVVAGLLVGGVLVRRRARREH